jgi:TolB-like protein/DNA-binding winged helix-turn-helix (wHTH) protein/Tfp pilus assembly protein PilF
MNTQEGGPVPIRFGEFLLDVRRGSLYRAGREIRLRPKSFRVLCYLVENRGRLVPKRELMDAIWGPAVVTEDSLTQCLIEVRRALGDEARKLVRTSPRRGYLFDARVAEVEPAPAAEQERPAAADPRWRLLAAGTAAAAVLAAVLVAAWLRQQPADPAATRSALIAVLPFEDMSEGGGQEFLADGIAEEILNTLSRSPDLHVIARTSSFSFKGRQADIATIGEALHVGYVLQGSVRRAGDRVRVSAQLVDTSDSAHVWSETFDLELTDVLAVQRDIAEAVARALAAHPPGSGPAPAVPPQAYELYLQGRFFHNRRAPGDSELAERYHRRALALAPGFGEAWAGLAGALLVQIVEEGRDTPEARDEWRRAVERALEHAPDSPETHVRANQYYWHTGDVARAREHRDHALALTGENALALSAAAGAESFRGRLETATELYRRAVALDPLSAVHRGNLAGVLAAAGRFREAIAEERGRADLHPAVAAEADRNVAFLLILDDRLAEAAASVERWPDDHWRDAALAMLHHAQGRAAESEAALDSLVRRVQASPEPYGMLQVAEVQAFRGAPGEAFRWLERAAEQAGAISPAELHELIHEVQLSPFLIGLRDDARWAPIVAPESVGRE